MRQAAWRTGLPVLALGLFAAFSATVTAQKLEPRTAETEPSRLDVRQEMARLRSELEQYVGRFNTLLKTDVAEYNKAAFDKGAPTLFAGQPIVLRQGVALPAPEQ